MAPSDLQTSEGPCVARTPVGVARLAAVSRRTRRSRAGGLLLPDERMISDAVSVYGWRYESAEVTYDRKTFMVGGPCSSSLRALSPPSATAAPGGLRRPGPRSSGVRSVSSTVVATTDRLLVWHQNAWWSVWYSAIEQSTCRDRQLHLRFLDTPPYLLDGDVSPLANAIASARPAAVDS